MGILPFNTDKSEKSGRPQLPGTRPEYLLPEAYGQQHVLDAAITALRAAAEISQEPLPVASVPNHLAQEPYRGQQAA